MRIQLPEENTIEIELLSRGASNYIYDCQLRVTFIAFQQRYSQNIWVDGAELQDFLRDLEILNTQLTGQAKLTSETPGELLLCFVALDGLGHLALQFELGKQIRIGPELFWSKRVEAFALDAQQFAAICRELVKHFSRLTQP